MSRIQISGILRVCSTPMLVLRPQRLKDILARRFSFGSRQLGGCVSSPDAERVLHLIRGHFLRVPRRVPDKLNSHLFHFLDLFNGHLDHYH